jgi:hypothetical protein
MSDSGFWPGLRGRQDECDTLSRLVASAQAGRSQVLVLRGEAGIGKTALLEFLADSARGCQVGRAAGVESELELAYASLHQLCSPYLDRIGTLPAPQRAALGTAFGLQPGRAPRAIKSPTESSHTRSNGIEGPLQRGSVSPLASEGASPTGRRADSPQTCQNVVVDYGCNTPEAKEMKGHL